MLNYRYVLKCDFQLPCCEGEWDISLSFPIYVRNITVLSACPFFWENHRHEIFILTLLSAMEDVSPGDCTSKLNNPIVGSYRLRWLHLCREIRPAPTQEWMSWIWHKTIWRGSSHESLDNVEYPFINITLRSTWTRISRTCFIYG